MIRNNSWLTVLGTGNNPASLVPAVVRAVAGVVLIVTASMFGGILVHASDAPDLPVFSAGDDEINENMPDAVHLVRLTELARRERAIQYQEVRTLFRQTAPETVVRKVWWRPPSELRLEEEHEAGRRLLLWSGRSHSLLDSRFPFVLRVRWDKGPPMAPLATMSPRVGGTGEDDVSRVSTVTWRLAGADGPGGRPVYVVEREFKHGLSKYWIDREHYFVWKEEHYSSNRELAAVIVRTDVDFAPDIPDETFRFEQPDEMEIISDIGEWRRRTLFYHLVEEAPFAPAFPDYVPSGYVLVDGAVVLLQEQPAVHLRFYDGVRLLSVFQLSPDETNPLARTTPELEQVEDADVLIVSGTRRGYLFFIVGQVSTAEAQKMLDHMRLSEEADGNSH